MIEDLRRANLDEARIERKDNLKLLPSFIAQQIFTLSMMGTALAMPSLT